MNELWTWVAANPELVSIVAGAVLSLLYKLLDDTKAGHAALSFVAAAMPFDLPKMAASLGKLIQAVAKKKTGAGTVVALVIAASALPACSAQAAEATYLARQLKCIDLAATKAEADTCRAAVKTEWAKKDGGAE